MTVLHEKLRGKDTGYWIIQCTNPLTHKRTTIRRNPKTDAKFKTKRLAQEFELQFLKSSTQEEKEITALNKYKLFILLLISKIIYTFAEILQ